MGGVFGLVNTEQEVLGHEKAVMATVSDGQIVATLKVLSTCYYTQRSQGACMFCRVARCSFLGPDTASVLGPVQLSNIIG